MSQLLDVYLYNRLTGRLHLKSGSMHFDYEPGINRPLSFSMPVNEKGYANNACEAYFGGLLPEGQDTRKTIAKAVGANSNSTYSLLEQIGIECAGAVQLCTSEQKPDLRSIYKLEGKELSDEKLAEMITELPSHPLFIQDDFRLSLAGAQQKGALCMIEGKLYIPNPGIPTTHILKPSINHPDTPHTVENEFFCMTLARLVGLKTPDVHIRLAKEKKFLLIKRYDRAETSSHTVDNDISRVHQEDFCQALGTVSTKKYEADGGPTLVKCFELIERLEYPARDKLELLKRVLFNFIVGNADCHSKNFSILHHYKNYSELSPCYDILCTAVYPKHTTKLAMSIGKEADMNKIRAENWTRFIKKIDVTPANFKKIATELAASTHNQLAVLEIKMVEKENWLPICDEISNIIKKRIGMLQLSLEKI